MSPVWCLLALLAAGPEAKEPPLPEPLAQLFEEKGEDGAPVLGEAERAALERLPRHTLELAGRKADALLISGAAHLKTLLSLKLTPQSAELVFADNCILCHSDREAQKKRLLFSPDPAAAGSPEVLNLKDYLSDVHFRQGLSCSGCHGGSPEADIMPGEVSARWPKAEVRKEDRTWVPDFCGRCHADPGFMRSFNPGLPTDQLAKYKESKHGMLLLQKKDSKAAQCASCHGVHGIRGAKSRQSHVHAQALPETCGKCHASAQYMAGYKREDGQPLPTDQVEKFKGSVHGRALLEKGDLGAPSCNDCHGNHAAMPPQVSTVSQVCRTCHTMNGTLFDGSKHKQRFKEYGWPECEKCHGNHAIEKPTDALVSADEKALCGGCHAVNARANPDCNAGAKYFGETLAELSAKAAGYPQVVEHLAERGLDPEPIVAALGELDEALVQARTRLHTFDRDGFDVGAQAGREAARKADELIAAAWAEHGFRRNGLLVSIGFMGFLALMLLLKIRDLDRGRRP